MRCRGRFLALVSLAAALSVLPGCKSELRGRVVSSTTGAPIANAVVVVSRATTATDEAGSFALAGLNRGRARGVVKVEEYPDTPFDIDLSRGEVSTVVEIADCRLAISARENAVEPRAVKSFLVSVAGRDATGAGSLSPLPPGTHLLRIESSGRETLETTVALKPGPNKVTVALDLTPVETYRRFFTAGQFHRDSVAYRYIHPDERKRLSLKKWVAWGSGTEDKSIKFGDVRMLKKWKSAFVGRTYGSVAEIDRTITYQVTDPKYSDVGKIYSDNLSQHWVQLSGRWYLVHAKGPD